MSGDDRREPVGLAGDGSSAGGRAGLSRAGIVECAVGLVDRTGLENLTMRRLGAECGVEAMALYRYVNGRDDLLAAIVDQLVDQLYSDQLAARRAEDGWQDYLQRLAHGVRGIALDHPALFPLVCTRAPEAPWLRPPLRSLRWLETFLDTMLAAGFDDDGAVAAYRSYTTFLLGHLLLEVSARGATPSAEIDASAVGAFPDAHSSPDTHELSDYPHLLRLRDRLSDDQTAAEFEEALEALLDRLEVLLKSR